MFDTGKPADRKPTQQAPHQTPRLREPTRISDWLADETAPAVATPVVLPSKGETRCSGVHSTSHAHAQQRHAPPKQPMDADNDSGTLVARRAESERDLHAVARLRFDVYVAEHGKAYPGADPARKTLTDELDHDADIMLIEHPRACVIGTVRANSLGSAKAAAHYGALFDLAAFAHVSPQEIVVCSRLAVKQEYRDSKVRAQLFEAIYVRRVVLGTRLCFATCAPDHLAMYAGYGFREIATPIEDPIGGRLHRILLRLDDVEHLEAVQSPFANIAHLFGLRDRMRSRPVEAVAATAAMRSTAI